MSQKLNVFVSSVQKELEDESPAMSESIKNPSKTLRNPSNGIPALLCARPPGCAPANPSVFHQFLRGIHQRPIGDRSSGLRFGCVESTDNLPIWRLNLPSRCC